MSVILTVIVTVLMFGILIVCHEFGHFIVAVKSGVDVTEFSIGFGPLLFQRKTKHTMLSIRAIPLGGYCQMPEEDEEGKKGYYDVHPLKRIALSLAGPMMNFLFAVLLFFMIYVISGTHATTTIAGLNEISPAREAGIVAGDTITAINNKQTGTWEEVSAAIDQSNGETISVTVRKKDASVVTYEITPLYDEANNDYYIGILAKTTFKLGYAVVNSFKMVGIFIALIFDVFVGMFRGIYGLEAFSGPIGVGAVVGQYLKLGIENLLYLAAAISISLGFFNLLPIPALDGSKIIFSFAELLRGKPISRKFENIFNTVGFILLMGFAAIVAYLDVVRIITN